jgi:hypothetical protein
MPRNRLAKWLRVLLRRTARSPSGTDTGQTSVFLYVRAGCRRTYTQSGLGGQIRQLTDRRTTSPPIVEETQRSSDASLRQRLTLAHVRIRELDDENRHLRDQIAHLLGQLRANRIADSGVVADTVYNANSLIRLPNDQPDPR